MQQGYLQATSVLYRMAMLLLGSKHSAQELTVQALRTLSATQPKQADADTLKIAGAAQLLRDYISQADATDTIDFAEDSPLSALLRLPDEDRQLCAMRLCGFSDAEMSDVLDCTLAALSPRLETAMRRLTFSQNGDVPDWNALQTAADALAPTENDLNEMRDALAEKVSNSKQIRKIEVRKSGKVQEFSRENADELYNADRKPVQNKNNSARTVRLPIWGVALMISLPLLLAVASTALLLSEKKHADMQSQKGNGLFVPKKEGDTELPELPYLDFAEARTQVLDYADVSETSATFIKTKLCTDTTPVSYDIIFLDNGGTQYEYILDAESGTLIDFQTTETDTTLDAKDFVPLEEVRAIALDCAGLENAIFTKEKLDNDNGTYYFKLEFLDAQGKGYEVSLLAKTGTIIKYTVKDAVQQDTSRFISIEKAKEQALLRAGIQDSAAVQSVIFTKEKLDGKVYLLAFTIEDGTQYIVELDAETGLVNIVDTIPVSADSSEFIGLTNAKEIALQRAELGGLTDEAKAAILFSKAKIERSQAAYVYEFEFQTADYEYEVKLHAQTGEVLKYRALVQ